MHKCGLCCRVASVTFVYCHCVGCIVSECILSYELSRTSRLDVANGIRVNSSLALELLI